MKTLRAILPTEKCDEFIKHTQNFKQSIKQHTDTGHKSATEVIIHKYHLNQTSFISAVVLMNTDKEYIEGITGF